MPGRLTLAECATAFQPHPTIRLVVSGLSETNVGNELSRRNRLGSWQLLGRSRAPFLSAGFPTPPTEPGVRLSPHRALQRSAFLLQDYSQIRHPVGFHLLRHQHFRGLQLVASGTVDLLVPFALGPAFPAADYYGTSDAAQVSPPELLGSVAGQPPTFTPTDSAR